MKRPRKINNSKPKVKKKKLSCNVNKKTKDKNKSQCNIKIRGKRYRFERTGHVGSDCWGYCTDPSTPNRVIKVHSHLKDDQELEFIIHEMIHACFWDLDEDVVREVGRDLSKALWRMGYRRGL